MANATNKTVPTDTAVDTFVASVENATRRADARRLVALYRRVTGEEPCMWGPSIIGFGSYHYRYDSGREGDAPRSGFSPRKANISLYLIAAYCDAETKAQQDRLLARLGKHTLGKSCLYVNRLDDIDIAVLERLIAHNLTAMDARYPR